MLQQGTDEWRQARCGSVGASDAPRVVRRTKTGYSADRDSLMAAKVLERLTGVPVEIPKSAAMLQGTAREPEARMLYEMVRGVEVEQVGLVPHPLIKGAHASPDGYVSGTGLIEIKCPLPAAHLDTLITETISNDHFVQVQFQLACTGRHWCDYVSFNPDFPPQCSSGSSASSATRASSASWRARSGSSSRSSTGRSNSSRAAMRWRRDASAAWLPCMPRLGQAAAAHGAEWLGKAWLDRRGEAGNAHFRRGGWQTPNVSHASSGGGRTACSLHRGAHAWLARLGKARLGAAWRGTEMHGIARSGVARNGCAWRGKARLNNERKRECSSPSKFKALPP